MEAESLEEVVLEPSWWWEIDSVYEFDASQFFDFTSPESACEAEEAERWFQVAGYYPPSPVFFKLKLENIIPIMSKVSSPTNNEKIKGTTYNDSCHKDEDTPKSKAKSKSSKPRSSTLMKPTACQLARQNHIHAHTQAATKRHKLENGYASKVAPLMKHQASLLHKSSKKGGSPGAKTLKSRNKLNFTVPKEPNLETQRRAQWRRFKSKIDLDSSENVTQKPNVFKFRSLNKKESKLSNDGKLLQQPPIELFSKLSLKSDMDTRTGAASQPKHPFGKAFFKDE